MSSDAEMARWVGGRCVADATGLDWLQQNPRRTRPGPTWRTLARDRTVPSAPVPAHPGMAPDTAPEEDEDEPDDLPGVVELPDERD
jgi:hypothetical protein